MSLEAGLGPDARKISVFFLTLCRSRARWRRACRRRKAGASAEALQHGAAAAASRAGRAQKSAQRFRQRGGRARQRGQKRCQRDAHAARVGSGIDAMRRSTTIPVGESGASTTQSLVARTHLPVGGTAATRTAIAAAVRRDLRAIPTARFSISGADGNNNKTRFWAERPQSVKRADSPSAWGG